MSVWMVIWMVKTWSKIGGFNTLYYHFSTDNAPFFGDTPPFNPQCQQEKCSKINGYSGLALKSRVV